MMLSRVEIDRYLARIQYSGARQPTAEVLRGLQISHLLSVPFENLSVRRGETVRLDEGWLFEKVVVRRRGGYCYELNGLFAALLETLGFRVLRLAARVGPDGIDFDHLVLRVELEEPWLADVGFGDSFLVPLQLDSRAPQDGGEGRSYRLEEGGDGLILLRNEREAWKRQFSFGPRAWPLQAFEPGNQFHQTSPLSHFTRNTVVSLATPGGRVTLSERRLITTERGLRSERTLDESEVEGTLRHVFGLSAGA
jgi:N-hydroxyarylamine O-acetyltransferase